MSRKAVTVEISGSSPVVARAVAQLVRHDKLSVSLRLIRTPEQAPQGRVLRIEMGSLVRSVLTLLWGEDDGREPADRDVELALSPVIWSNGTDVEAWHITGRPLNYRACLGSPEPARPWVLVSTQGASVAAVEEATGLENPQLHFLGSAATPSRGTVNWLPTRRTIASLLGHVDAVFGAEAPLAWDAARAGVRIVGIKTGDTVPAELATRRLSRTVPPILATNADFWVTLATSLVEGVEPGSWGTANWIRWAREQQDVTQTEARWKRKLNKLQRDPKAFWADSWIVRQLYGAKRRS